MAPVRRMSKATLADLERLPDHVVGELIAGELFVSPRPSPQHARATSSLTAELGPFARRPGDRGPGGWIILFEPELHLDGSVLVPDLAGWHLDRMPPSGPGVGVKVTPDWLCEVLSPSTASLDRTRKMPLYASLGISHLWLIDPLARSLEVFRLEGGRWSMVAAFGEDAPAMIRAEPFDAIEIELARFWWPEPPASP